MHLQPGNINYQGVSTANQGDKMIPNHAQPIPLAQPMPPQIVPPQMIPSQMMAPQVMPGTSSDRMRQPESVDTSRQINTHEVNTHNNPNISLPGTQHQHASYAEQRMDTRTIGPRSGPNLNKKRGQASVRAPKVPGQRNPHTYPNGIIPKFAFDGRPPSPDRNSKPHTKPYNIRPPPVKPQKSIADLNALHDEAMRVQGEIYIPGQGRSQALFNYVTHFTASYIQGSPPWYNMNITAEQVISDERLSASDECLRAETSLRTFKYIAYVAGFMPGPTRGGCGIVFDYGYHYQPDCEKHRAYSFRMEPDVALPHKAASAVSIHRATLRAVLGVLALHKWRAPQDPNCILIRTSSPYLIGGLGTLPRGPLKSWAGRRGATRWGHENIRYEEDAAKPLVFDADLWERLMYAYIEAWKRGTKIMFELVPTLRVAEANS
jgi:hypothetical protein